MKKLAWSVLISAQIILIYFIYLLFFPFKIAEVKSPMVVLTPQIKKGETLNILMEYSKYKPLVAHITRSIYCGDNLVTLTPTTSDLPVGENLKQIVTVEIPEKTSLGKCRIEYINEYTINHLRNIEYRYQTGEFEVLD